MNEIEFLEIYPKIIVYKNLFKNIDNTFNTIKNSEKLQWPDKTLDECTELWRNGEGDSIIKPWFQWYTFGTTTDEYNFSIPDSENTINEKSVILEIKNIFDISTEHYMSYYNKQKDKDHKEWSIMGPSICKYIDGQGVTEDLAMHYHPDYQLENQEEPGRKFALTCTMYLNDDYEGGEISFLIGKKIFSYKPKAGEVIVFPAGDPNYFSEDGIYYHGVKKSFGSDRYFIRNNWCYWYDGSDEWHANKDKYGEQLWAEMEQERKLAERYQNKHQANIPEDAVIVYG